MATKLDCLLDMYPQVTSLVKDVNCTHFTKSLFLRECMPKEGNDEDLAKLRKPRERDLLDILDQLISNGELSETRILSPPLIDFSSGPLYSSLEDGTIEARLDELNARMQRRWVNRAVPEHARAFAPRLASKALRMHALDPLEEPQNGLTFLDQTNLYLHLKRTKTSFSGFIPWWIGLLMMTDPMDSNTPHATYYSSDDSGMMIVLVCRHFTNDLPAIIDFAKHWACDGYNVELW